MALSLRQEPLEFLGADPDNLALGNPHAAEEPNNRLFDFGGVKQSVMVRMRRSQEPTSVPLRNKRDSSGATVAKILNFLILRGASDSIVVAFPDHPSDKEPRLFDGLLQCRILLLGKRL